MDEEKKKAICDILYALKYPLVLTSIVSRDETLAVAKKFNVTAEELIEAQVERNRRV